MNAPVSADVVIVGGGISGLAAAYELQRRGVDVRLLEATSRLGGVLRTEHTAGFVIDGGPDSILIQKPAGLALCRELGIDGELVSTLPPRTACVLRDGRLHPIAEGSFLGFPITAHALATTSLFSLVGKVRMAREVLVPARRDDADESVADFVRRRFGQEAVDYLAEPLLAGIHAGNVDRLSVRALFPRLVDAERTTGSVLRSVRRTPRTPSERGAFVSFPGGIGRLVEALTSALSSIAIETGTSVTRIARGDSATGSTFTLETSGSRVVCRALVLATPAHAAVPLLAPLDEELGRLSAGVPYASTATVSLGFGREQVAHPLTGSGFVVPRAEGRALLAATWTSSKWPGRAPAGHVLMRGFLGGGRDPKRLDADNATLERLCLDELRDIAGIVGEPVVSRVYRWTRQSPQFEVGHLARVAAIDECVARVPGLFVTGSGFRAIGIPDCIEDGRAVGARAASFLQAPRA